MITPLDSSISQADTGDKKANLDRKKERKLTGEFKVTTATKVHGLAASPCNLLSSAWWPAKDAAYARRTGIKGPTVKSRADAERDKHQAS